MKPLVREFVPHVYRTGESYEYFFEVTEASYSTEQLDRLPMIKDLFKIEDLFVRLKLSILSVEGDETRQQVELLETGYRELGSEELRGARSGGGSSVGEAQSDSGRSTGATAAGGTHSTDGRSTDSGGRAKPHQSLSSMIPDFPERLSYSYTGGNFIAALNEACGPYLNHPLGIFLHYKLIDVHSFQSVIDDVASGELPNDVVISPSEDIEVEHGVFHNHEPVRVYHRVDLLNGVPHAYFKFQTMGNVFRVPSQSMDMHTNYQITLHAPLEGDAAGLITNGEQQELGYTDKVGEPVIAVQRQLSMNMQSDTSRSGVNWEAD